MKWSKSLSASLVVIAALAGAASAAPLTRVSVDTSIIGGGPMAAHVRQALARDLARELAMRPVEAPPGARLVIRIREIHLVSQIGISGRGDFRGAAATPDAVDGEALIVDGRGGIIARKAVSGRSNPSAGGMAPITISEPRRIEELMGNFAYWIVRGLN